MEEDNDQTAREKEKEKGNRILRNEISPRRRGRITTPVGNIDIFCFLACSGKIIKILVGPPYRYHFHYVRDTVKYNGTIVANSGQ